MLFHRHVQSHQIPGKDVSDIQIRLSSKSFKGTFTSADKVHHVRCKLKYTNSHTVYSTSSKMVTQLINYSINNMFSHATNVTPGMTMSICWLVDHFGTNYILFCFFPSKRTDCYILQRINPMAIFVF